MALWKNTWDNNFYRGINSRWVDPETKQMFEVQFHTPSSYYAKEELNHKLYERARNPMTGRLEGRECNDLQATTTTLIPVPDGATELHFEPDDEEVK